MHKTYGYDVWIEYYYGTYNGCVVVMITGAGHGYWQMTQLITVADSLFGYPDSKIIMVWKDGKFYELRNEVYDTGLLTKEDIAKIALLHEERSRRVTR
jgi:hypothetical protein